MESFGVSDIKIHSERITRVHNGLKGKFFKINDIKEFDLNGVRPLRYWIELGLVGDLGQGKGVDATRNEKFNFYEFMWVLIIRELKGLNFDNAIIKSCAEEVFSREDSHYPILAFEKAVLFSLVNRRDAFFVVNKEGGFEVLPPDGLNEIGERNRERTCVVMNLMPLIRGFLLVSDFWGYIEEKGLLQENEIRALNLLRESKTVTVTIELDNKSVTIKAGKGAVIKFIGIIFVPGNKKISVQL